MNNQAKARPCCVCGVAMSAIDRISWESLQPDGGGEIRLLFHYGSRFDHHLEGTEFRGIICDDCAAKVLGGMYLHSRSDYAFHGDASQYASKSQWENGIAPFAAPSQHVDIAKKGRRIGTISVGGPILRIMCGRREVAFEMHNYFGPTPVNKRTHEALTREPAGFWDAVEAWVRGGKVVDGDRCVVEGNQ